MTAPALAYRIIEIIKPHRLPMRREVDMQNRVAEILTEAKLEHCREWRPAATIPGQQGRRRIDFKLEATTGGRTLGVELKIAGSAAEVNRQLLDYALSGEFAALLLITIKPFSGLPDFYTVQGVPVPLIQYIHSNL